MSVSKVNIMGRVHHLTIKIYPEMLRITRGLDGTKNITIDSDHWDVNVPYRDFPWTPQYRNVLSYALLTRMTMEGGTLPLSFTNFITTKELSDPFYISPDIFHTQITEYSLLTFYR